MSKDNENNTPQPGATLAENAEDTQTTQAAETTAKHPYEVPAGDNNQNNSTPTFLSHIRAGFWD
jgi:hypothetical protein